MHLLSCRAAGAGFAIVSAFSLRGAFFRLTGSLDVACGPALASLGVTAWRAFPALRIGRAKPWFWVELIRESPDGGGRHRGQCGLSVKMANCLGFYFGTIDGTVGALRQGRLDDQGGAAEDPRRPDEREGRARRADRRAGAGAPPYLSSKPNG
jgi:hypothetical protein